MAKRTRQIDVIGERIVAAPTNYQGFVYNRQTGECKPNNPRMIAKWKAVEAVFGDLVQGRTFLDIGSLHGFFCLKALECGATKATGIEVNEGFFRPMQDALLKLPPIPGLVWLKVRWPDGELHADVTMALSLIHHLVFKDDMTPWDIVYHLHACTNVVCIAEMIGREDNTVKNYLAKKDLPGYTIEYFEELARAIFHGVERIGVGHGPHRPIYLLWKD